MQRCLMVFLYIFFLRNIHLNALHSHECKVLRNFCHNLRPGVRGQLQQPWQKRKNTRKGRAGIGLGAVDLETITAHGIFWQHSKTSQTKCHRSWSPQKDLWEWARGIVASLFHFDCSPSHSISQLNPSLYWTLKFSLCLAGQLSATCLAWNVPVLKVIWSLSQLKENSLDT